MNTSENNKENLLRVMNDFFMDINFIAHRAKMSNDDTIKTLKVLLQENLVVENEGRWRKT